MLVGTDNCPIWGYKYRLEHYFIICVARIVSSYGLLFVFLRCFFLWVIIHFACSYFFCDMSVFCCEFITKKNEFCRCYISFALTDKSRFLLPFYRVKLG